MAPLELVTGMPIARPEELPLSITTVLLHESVEVEIMRAAVDCRL